MFVLLLPFCHCHLHILVTSHLALHSPNRLQKQVISPKMFGTRNSMNSPLVVRDQELAELLGEG